MSVFDTARNMTPPATSKVGGPYGVLPELWTSAMLGFPHSEENQGEEESL